MSEQSGGIVQKCGYTPFGRLSRVVMGYLQIVEGAVLIATCAYIEPRWTMRFSGWMLRNNRSLYVWKPYRVAASKEEK